MSIRPSSVHMEQLTPSEQISVKFDILSIFFQKSLNKTQAPLKSDNNDGFSH